MNLMRPRHHTRTRTSRRPAGARDATRSRVEGSQPSALLQLARIASEDWAGSIRQIVQLAAEVLQVERVSYWTVGEGTATIHCEASYSLSTRFFERGATLSKATLPDYFERLQRARVLSVEDVHVDLRVSGLGDYLAARGTSSLLDVPVRFEGRLAGVLCYEHVGPPRCWSAAEADAAADVAQVIGYALVARAHTHAEEVANVAEFLDHVSYVLAQSLDVREVASRAVDLVVPRLGDGALVYALNRDGALECLATTHVDPRLCGHVAELARAEIAQVEPPGLPRRVARQRHSMLDRDVSLAVLERYGLSQPLRSVLATLDTRTSMGVPLRIGGNVFGSMTFFATSRRFGDDDLALAERVGNRVAVALENARLYAVAREAIRARDDLLELAAHELRTPVTALKLMTDNLLRKARRGGEPDETARSESIAGQVRRFSALVDHMLDALTIRAEGVTLAIGPCDLVGVVGRCVQRVAERARAAGIPIEVDSAPSVTGRWDAERLERVVDCLLDNALKFGGKQPVALGLRVEGSEAVLSVCDHGIGIQADRLSSIFDPFERAAAKQHFGGLGLGLYVAKAYVEAHGGSITAKSRLGEGATFVVRLPLAPGATPIPTP
jgi:signal transduction histidine kinase